ncbi:MAG TPA: Zn-dependent hydrolase [Gammaproteobacteria bacterium]|nr:Zn-dependent hydrolase [Gammaproteobacteria bacterium]
MPRFIELLIVGLVAGVLAAAPGVHGAAPQSDAVVAIDLDADLGHASLRDAQTIRLLIDAARIMETLYRQQLAPGGLYPADMSRGEFEAWADTAALSPYTRIRRNAVGALEAVPYHEAWPRELGQAARLLARAAEITDDEALRSYLTLRARALITGDYARAEAAWVKLRHSDLDVLVGPIGSGADREYGLKAAFGARVLLQDWAWGARLAQLTVFLPQLQQSLPVSGAFKDEIPDVAGKLGVYDLLYHAGDERVRLRQGAGRLLLRNVMRARFDALAMPVAGRLVVPEQHATASFDAWFLNTIFTEMAHGLGLRRTIDDRGTVADALREYADTIEEAKAAVLSLWIADWLRAAGELPETTRTAHYVSFLAGIFHAVRGDAYSASGQAKMMLFNYFRDWGAFRRDAATGRYRVVEADMAAAIEAFATQLLTLQGGGDYVGAADLVASLAALRPELRADLEGLEAAGLPAAVEFRQGEHLLGL